MHNNIESKHDLSFVLKSFSKAYLYESHFTTFEGKAAKTESVVLIRPGRDILYYVNQWNNAAASRYTLIKEISIQDAIELPAIPDRLSIKGKLELIGDDIEYLTHEYKLTYL